MTNKSIQDSVVVITGAASGIGRAAAHGFAREGAKLVLAARSLAPLLCVAVECEEFGARCLVVPTDVTSEAEVKALAFNAVSRFGRIDIWINNTEGNLYQGAQEWNGVTGEWPESRIYSKRKLVATGAALGALAVVREVVRRRAA